MLGYWDATEHHHLDGDTWAETEEDPPLEPMARGGHLLRLGRLPDLVEDEQHGGAGHVAVLCEHLPCSPELVLLQPQLRFDLTEDLGTAWMRHPEDRVPISYAERMKCFDQAALDAVGYEVGHSFR